MANTIMLTYCRIISSANIPLPDLSPFLRWQRDPIFYPDGIFGCLFCKSGQYLGTASAYVYNEVNDERWNWPLSVSQFTWRAMHASGTTSRFSRIVSRRSGWSIQQRARHCTFWRLGREPSSARCAGTNLGWKSGWYGVRDTLERRVMGWRMRRQRQWHMTRIMETSSLDRTGRISRSHWTRTTSARGWSTNTGSRPTSTGSVRLQESNTLPASVVSRPPTS
ncbi:hypothetical protein B0J17DRAFT_737316 [Rhizoctonia solani]|nr:hypothetical protein B0J17DRAFT_737316 [Rhizoctonia solani]